MQLTPHLAEPFKRPPSPKNAGAGRPPAGRGVQRQPLPLGHLPEPAAMRLHHACTVWATCPGPAPGQLSKSHWLKPILCTEANCTIVLQVPAARQIAVEASERSEANWRLAQSSGVLEKLGKSFVLGRQSAHSADRRQLWRGCVALPHVSA